MEDNPLTSRVTRRRSLQLLAGTMVASAAPGLDAAAPLPARRTGMGLVIYNCSIRRRWLQQHQPGLDLFQPHVFLKHCHAQGAGGMQAPLGVLPAAEVDALRRFADEHDLYVEAIIGLPQNQLELERFESEIQTACDAGAKAARTTIIPGRRYERFKTLAEFREYERRGQRMLELAAPLVEKHRLPLAVENHKDQRLDERIALFEHLDSPFVGACLDTGNSFALLDGAHEPIAALAPYAFSVHLKDQALQEASDGFMLGDIPLGQGSFDLPAMVAVIQRAKPQVRFTLELITRDPLEVPCLSEDYFATLPDVPASDLARTIRFVRDHSAAQLPAVDALPIEQQLALEDANVAASIKYAADVLGL